MGRLMIAFTLACLTLFANPTLAADIKPITAPTLNIPIPGLTFTPILTPKDGSFYVPYLAQYIAAAYAYLVGVSVIAAAIMIMYGGFKYVVGSTIESVQGGKTIIADAIIGLLLILGSYAILQAVNPETTTLPLLKVETIEPSEVTWLTENGSGIPGASDEAIERTASLPFPGRTAGSTVPTEQTAPSPGPTGGSTVPTEEVVEKVDISPIPFDRSSGATANLANYCTPKSEAAAATTYEQKIQLLVKAVLGWHKTCVQNGLCVYCQACSTNPTSGAITSLPAAQYVVKNCVDKNITACVPGNVWAGDLYKSCREVWLGFGEYEGKANPYAVNAMPLCTSAAQNAYQSIFVSAFERGKYWAGDCGSFVRSLFRCAGAEWKESPKGTSYTAQGKPVKTVYLSILDVPKVKDIPGIIVAAKMTENIEALAAQHGGLKFGDMVYIHNGVGGHWLLYTGGRPDVPFDIIEMGGKRGGVTVAGLGRFSGVGTYPKGTGITGYLAPYIETQTATFGGKTYSKPAENLDKKVIFVWRPYAE